MAVVDRRASGLVLFITQQIAQLASTCDPRAIVALKVEARGQAAPTSETLKYDAFLGQWGAVGRFKLTNEIDRGQVGLKLRDRPAEIAEVIGLQCWPDGRETAPKLFANLRQSMLGQGCAASSSVSAVASVDSDSADGSGDPREMVTC